MDDQQREPSNPRWGLSTLVNIATALRSSCRAVTLMELAVATGVVAFLIRIPYIFGPIWGTRYPDAGVYLTTAHDLTHGHWFAHATEMRTPAYPLLLAALSYLPGGLVRDTVILQHLVGVAFSVGLAAGAWRFFGRGAAAMTAVIAALSPLFVDIEGEVLPDFLLAVTITVGAFLLAAALAEHSASVRRFAYTGAMFGLAALIKPVGQVLLVTGFLPLATLRWGWRPRLATATALMGGCLVVMSPWLVRNIVRYGDIRMSVQDGPALWLRLFDYDHRPIPTGHRDDALAQKLYDETVVKTPGATTTGTYEYVLAALETPPYNWSERHAAAFQRTVALEAIRAAPGNYVLRTYKLLVGAFIQATKTVAPPRYNLAIKRQHSPPYISTALSRAGFSLASNVMWLWWIASFGLFSVFALAFSGERKARAATVALGACYLAVTTATAATTFSDYRYGTQTFALLWVLGSAGVALIARSLWRAARSS